MAEDAKAIDSPATAEELEELWLLVHEAYLEMMRQPKKPKAYELQGIVAWLKMNGYLKNLDSQQRINDAMEDLKGLDFPIS